MKTRLLFAFLFPCTYLCSQELFVNTESASNIPAKSLSLKVQGHFVTVDPIFDRPAERYIPVVSAGITNKLMVTIGGSLSDMHTANFRGESIFLYGKYRFLSNDELHQHFRMAAFLRGSKTNAPFHYHEATLVGDKTGVDLGLITTSLWNKFALSSTVSHMQLLDKSRFSKTVYLPKRGYSLINYSLSAGYLLLPRTYTSYKQINLNLYLEALAQQGLDVSKHYIDLAPALQTIFFSSTKLSFSYRFQISGNMDRMKKDSWMITIERSFLNALRKKNQAKL